MDAVALERVSEAWQHFHDYFAPDFGRREAREQSRHYLQALLVQSEERRNTENLSETVPASPRALQRFLAESPWDDDAVIDRLQEYLGSRLEDPHCHPRALGPLHRYVNPPPFTPSNGQVNIAHGTRNLAGNPESPQAVIFWTSITEVIMSS